MGETRVDLLGPIRVIHEHLTKALCEAVFDERRISERRRRWTLQAMAEFWTAVIIRAPASLRQALDESQRGAGGFPLVKSSPESFFERAQGMRWEFFSDLFEAFSASALKDHARAFEADLRESLPCFPEVLVVDGSRLDAIAHRLKVLWDERVVVLPGSLLVLYDLYRGVPLRVHFDEDSNRAEVPALKGELDAVPKGALLLGDRAFCSHRLFGDFKTREIWAVVRCTKAIGIEHQSELSRAQHDGGVLRDTIVVAGTTQKPSQRQSLRLIEWRGGKKSIRLLTNVLDPQKLPASAAIALYRRRWSVERMFYDLKEVLNLHRFYAANVNAIAMQVFAAALVYVALRIAQARIAKTTELKPEQLSVEKLFPRVASASTAFVTTCLTVLALRAANPGVAFVEPDWSEQPYARVPLDSVLVEPRNPKRRRRRSCPARRRHASLHNFTRRHRH
jgi:Transposase DDE domain